MASKPKRPHSPDGDILDKVSLPLSADGTRGSSKIKKKTKMDLTSVSGKDNATQFLQTDPELSTSPAAGSPSSSVEKGKGPPKDHSKVFIKRTSSSFSSPPSSRISSEITSPEDPENPADGDVEKLRSWWSDMLGKRRPCGLCKADISFDSLTTDRIREQFEAGYNIKAAVQAAEKIDKAKRDEELQREETLARMTKWGRGKKLGSGDSSKTDTEKDKDKDAIDTKESKDKKDGKAKVREGEKLVDNKVLGIFGTGLCPRCSGWICLGCLKPAVETDPDSKYGYYSDQRGAGESSQPREEQKPWCCLKGRVVAIALCLTVLDEEFLGLCADDGISASPTTGGRGFKGAVRRSLRTLKDKITDGPMTPKSNGPKPARKGKTKPSKDKGTGYGTGTYGAVFPGSPEIEWGYENDNSDYDDSPLFDLDTPQLPPGHMHSSKFTGIGKKLGDAVASTADETTPASSGEAPLSSKNPPPANLPPSTGQIYIDPFETLSLGYIGNPHTAPGYQLKSSHPLPNPYISIGRGRGTGASLGSSPSPNPAFGTPGPVFPSPGPAFSPLGSNYGSSYHTFFHGPGKTLGGGTVQGPGPAAGSSPAVGPAPTVGPDAAATSDTIYPPSYHPHFAAFPPSASVYYPSFPTFPAHPLPSAHQPPPVNPAGYFGPPTTIAASGTSSTASPPPYPAVPSPPLPPQLHELLPKGSGSSSSMAGHFMPPDSTDFPSIPPTYFTDDLLAQTSLWPSVFNNPQIAIRQRVVKPLQSVPSHPPLSAKQTVHDKTFFAIIKTLARLLSRAFPDLELSAPVPEIVSVMLRASMLAEKVEELLRNDSIQDISIHSDVYLGLMELLNRLSDCPNLEFLLLEQRRPKTLTLGLLKVAQSKPFVELPTESTGPKSRGKAAAAIEEKRRSEVLVYEDNFSRQNIVDVISKLGIQARVFLECARKSKGDEFQGTEAMKILTVCVEVTVIEEKLTNHASRTSRTTQGSSSSSNSVEMPSPMTRAPFMPSMMNLGYHGPLAFEYAEGVSRTHYFGVQAKNMKDSPRGRVLHLSRELATMSTSLPQGIFVRVEDGRPDIVKVLIVGPGETPYEGGLYEFDIWAPVDYPVGAPLCQFKTTGNGTVHFNPNLYNCGKVCLSILNTWTGTMCERWQPGTSTLLQVFVSIQSMILCANPWYNEPGRREGTQKKDAEEFNNRVRMNNVKWAMLDWLRDAEKRNGIWKDVIEAHFKTNKAHLLELATEWSKKEPRIPSVRTDAHKWLPYEELGATSLNFSASLEMELARL